MNRTALEALPVAAVGLLTGMGLFIVFWHLNASHAATSGLAAGVAVFAGFIGGAVWARGR